MTPLMRAKDLCFSYDDKNNIFTGISFDLFEGDVICILGANGCGKTTLLRCLMGALQLSRGEVLLGEVKNSDLSVTERAKRLAVVFQEHNPPFPFKVIDVVLMGRGPHLRTLARPGKQDIELARQAMKTIGITYLAEKTYTEISGGERQMVLIARALVQQTGIIFMDEPTSHLDFKNQSVVMDTVHMLAAQHGLGIVMTTHHPGQALLFESRAALMANKGFHAMGSAAQIINDENLKETYHLDTRVMRVFDEKTNRKYSVCIPLINK